MRALGFHEEHGDVQWALVEQPKEGPPEVLAAGSATATEVPAVWRRLAGGHRLPWGLAWSRGEARPRDFPKNWPRLHPSTLALVHPAIAAGIWEWERSRMEATDLFLWLRQNELFWSSGAPGVGPAGRLARKGPLQDLWGRLQQRLHQPKSAVVLAVDEQAPGRELLAELVQGSGLTWRHLRSHPEDRGADRAALGAALAAMEPERPGVLPPRRKQKSSPAMFGVFLLALLFLAAGGARLHSADLAADRPLPEAATWRAPADLSLPMDRILDRRAAFLKALEHSLSQTPSGTLEQLEILAGAQSRQALARLSLLPGATLSAQEWPGLQAPTNPKSRTWTAHYSAQE